MYVEIKENKLLSWCENPYLDYEFVNIDYSTFDVDKYEVQNGQLVDISGTQEYKDKVTAQENAIKKAELTAKIAELDTKRIRAIAEPSQKDENTTWLEFYTLQIQELRAEITQL